MCSMDSEAGDLTWVLLFDEIKVSRNFFCRSYLALLY